MLISFELSQIIERPIEEVFAFLSDFTNMSLWNYYIQQVTNVTPGKLGVGAIYEQLRPHDTNLYKVIEFVKPHKITVELQPPKPLQQYGFELQSINSHTLVNYQWQVDLSNYKALKFIPESSFKNWILSFARRHVNKNIKPATEQNFRKLKVLLETGEVTLQDGRKSSLNIK